MQKNEKRRRAGGDGFGPVLPVTECSLYLKAFKGRRTINHVFISFLLNFIRPRSDLSFDTSVPSSSSSVRSSLCSQILPPLWLPGLSLSQSDSTPPNYRDRSRCAVVDRPPPPPPLAEGPASHTVNSTTIAWTHFSNHARSLGGRRGTRMRDDPSDHSGVRRVSPVWPLLLPLEPPKRGFLLPAGWRWISAELLESPQVPFYLVWRSHVTFFCSQI